MGCCGRGENSGNDEAGDAATSLREMCIRDRVIDAPWAGVPVRIRWHKRRWICREHACQTVTFLEHSEKVCAPRARLGTRAIRWAIRQLRFEGATIAGLARQLATTWNTVWSRIKPCL